MEDEQQVDPLLHKNWRVALYYCYVDLSGEGVVAKHVQFQKELCESMEFQGRVRVSSEGVNVVLTGLHVSLQRYEKMVANELRSEGTCESVDLDVKYCHLRKDLPISSQLFQSLMVKETKTVISLFDNSVNDTQQHKSKPSNRRSNQSNRRRRRKERKQMQKLESSDNHSKNNTADTGNNSECGDTPHGAAISIDSKQVVSYL